LNQSEIVAMQFTIFYSWQTDTPSNCNRGFIRSAIESALKQIYPDATVEDSPRVDSGMEGIAGSPEVAAVMFEKIRTCALFIGDVTLVGTIDPREPGKEPKRVPNPNVLLEMGLAAGQLGWGRVICVMNESFGTRFEVPFDVRNRRFPITYCLPLAYSLAPEDSTSRTTVKEELSRTLRKAIEEAEKAENEAAEEALKRLDMVAVDIMRSNPGAEYFHLRAPQPNEDPSHFIIQNQAVARLLDLKLLRYNCSPEDIGLRWAYHWTYMGKLVMKKIGVQVSPIPTPPESSAPVASDAAVSRGQIPL
jgi:hypothetical protein